MSKRSACTTWTFENSGFTRRHTSAWLIAGVILVGDAGKTRIAALARATSVLARGAAQLLGLVINRVTHRVGGGYYYDYNWYYAKAIDDSIDSDGKTHLRGDDTPEGLTSLRRVIAKR